MALKSIFGSVEELKSYHQRETRENIKNYESWFI